MNATPPGPDGLTIGHIRAVTVAVMLFMLFVFVGTADREAILGGGPSSFEDLLIAAGLYTFPLTLAVFVIAYVALAIGESGTSVHPIFLAAGAAGILWVAGQISRLTAIGRPPADAPLQGSGWHLLASAFQAYLTTYGWPLTVCGIVTGLHLVAEVRFQRQKQG